MSLLLCKRTHSRTPQGKECVQGKPSSGFPCAFNQRPPQATTFAQQKCRTNKKRHTNVCLFLLVRAMGLEPTRSYEHRHLKPACLPIPARSRAEYLSIIAKSAVLSIAPGEFPHPCPLEGIMLYSVLQLRQRLADRAVHRYRRTQGRAGDALVHHRQLAAPVVLHQPRRRIDHQRRAADE